MPHSQAIDSLQSTEPQAPIDKEAILKTLVIALRNCTGTVSLAELLNLALPLHIEHHAQRKVKPLTGKVLDFYAYKKTTRYREFTIKKRAPGEVRIIRAPERGLKRIQRLLLLCLQAVFVPDEAAHGFTDGRSVLTNAVPHAGRRFVLNLDLKDFFTHTHFGRVVAVLQLPPFQLPRKAAHLVANLCCDNGALPQGAPTSPLLTNAVCQRLDRKLRQVATRFGCRYTRYADDLTFSSNRPSFTSAFHAEVNAIIKSEGYEPNKKKERLQTAEMRQEVTGIVVNQRPNVPREYTRLIRNMLHNWKASGYEAASATLRQHYGSSKAGSRYRGNVPKLERVLAGKIAYLGMVRGKEDALYLKYAAELALLANPEYAEFNKLLDILETATGNITVTISNIY